MIVCLFVCDGVFTIIPQIKFLSTFAGKGTNIEVRVKRMKS